MRAVIDAVRPLVDGGRFAVKRVIGDEMVVEADRFADGHDVLRVMLRWRAEGDTKFGEAEMAALGNDVWSGAFPLTTIGRYIYTVVAWVDHFASWRHELARRVDADDIRIAAQVGAMLVVEAATRASAGDRETLAAWAAKLQRGASDARSDVGWLKALALEDTLAALALSYPERGLEAAYPVELPLVVDRQRARASTWYEMFPRSAAVEPGRHGTFADVEAHLPYIAELGFDVLYFPPIHPIGRVNRKGENNSLVAA